MSTRHRMRLPTTLVALVAALALLAPTAAAADDTSGVDARAASSQPASSGSVWTQLQDQVEEWSQLLQERLATVSSASVDGKAAALPGASGESTSASSLAALSDIPCEDGRAAMWPCENVDLLSYVPNAMLGDANGNDLWGWTDQETGREYAIMGTGYGTSFIDVTEPTDPVVVARTATSAADYIPLWRDIKVHDDHAFIVAEHRSHGMQVVDLTELRDLEGPLPQPLEPVAEYDEFGNAHNIAINEDTGFAYAVGSSACDAGLHMIDINEPAAPEFAGCFAEDGYTHDVQCVVYEGPAADLEGHELCFASNEDTVTIVDVTDKDDPVQLSRTGYDSAEYTHQGWLTPDQDWFVFGDELDEQGGSVDNTTTYVMDVSDPTAPGEPVPYAHETSAIDHNLYIDADYVWQANYVAGLRVLDYTGEHGDGDIAADDAQAKLDEVAFFEVVPEADPSEFAGAWSVYPFFDSGTVVVSTLEQGLFVLGPTVDRPSLGDDGDEDSDGDDDGDGNDDGNGQGPPEEEDRGRPDEPGNGNGDGDGGNGDPQRPDGGRPGGGGAFV